MKKILIVVDMQKDFVNGSLGTAEAQKIVTPAAEYIKSFDGEIFATLDTHGDDYLSTPEGKKLPVMHCIKGSLGWEIADGLQTEGCQIIDKPNFGWTGWADLTLEQVELVGLCTDICVVSNALIIKATFPDAVMSVDASCCAGVTPESHEAALKTMAMCQIEITGR